MRNSKVFKFLDSYGKDDSSVFFGRETETQEIYQRCSFSKILVVYGRSGTGKTSIIRCGLGNAFNDQDWLPLFVRRKSDINLDVIKTIQEATTSQPDTKKSLKAEVRNLYLDHFKPVYLIFDQFEELFIFGEQDEIATFFESVKSLMQSDENVHLIFVIREEYLANLTEAEEVIPEFLENRIRIEHLTAKKLREVVEKMCAAAEINLEEGFAEELTERMTSGKAPLELSYLQVYLDSIRKKYPQATAFTKTMIDSLGSFSDVLSNFLQQQLDKQDDPAKGETVLKAFVSTQGTKRLVDLQELVHLTAEYGVVINEKELQIYVNRFVDGRILRQLGEDGKFELRHDTLAKVIYERITLAEKELLEAKQFVHNAWNRYQKNGTQLRDEDLVYLAPYTKRLYLKDEQKSFILDAFDRKEKKRRRRRRLTQVGMSIMLLLLIFAGYLLYQNYQEERLQARIGESHRLATLSKSDEIGDPMLAFLLAERAHKIYPGSHTHNALMEAYDRGPSSIETHQFDYVNFHEPDSSFYISHSKTGLKIFRLNDLDNILNTEIDLDFSMDYFRQVYPWGFKAYDENSDYTVFYDYASDTINSVKGSFGKRIDLFNGKRSSHVVYLNDSSGIYFDPETKLLKVFSLPERGYKNDDRTRFLNFFSLSDEGGLRKAYIQDNLLILIINQNVYQADITEVQPKFKIISNNFPRGIITYHQEYNAIEVKKEEIINVLDASDFTMKYQFDTDKYQEIGMQGLDIRKTKKSISKIFENYIILQFDWKVSDDNRTTLSLIFEIIDGKPKRIGGVKGEFIGLREGNVFLTYNAEEGTLSFEKRGGDMFQLLQLLNNPKADFTNVKMIAHENDRFLFYQEIEKPKSFTEDVSKWLLLMSNDGSVQWKMELPNTIKDHNAIKDFILEKNYSSLFIDFGEYFRLIEIDKDGLIHFSKDVPKSNRDNQLYRHELFRSKKRNYVLIDGNRLIQIKRVEQELSSKYYPKKTLLTLDNEIVIIDEDSAVAGLKIKSNLDTDLSFRLKKEYNQNPIKIEYHDKEEVVYIRYEFFNTNGTENYANQINVFKHVFYDTNSPVNLHALFTLLDSSQVFRRLGEYSSYQELSHKKYKLALLMDHRMKEVRSSRICLIDMEGHVDTINVSGRIGLVNQFGKYIYSCFDDTLLRIDLDTKEISYTPKSGLSSRYKVHFKKDENLLYRTPSWTEFFNPSGDRDTLYSGFKRIQLNNNQWLYLSKFQRYFTSLTISGEGLMRDRNTMFDGELSIVDSAGFLLEQILMPKTIQVRDFVNVTGDRSYFHIIDYKDGRHKILDINFAVIFTFPESTHVFESESFIHDKYLLTSHRLLNQYELFPINGDVAIEMVREQGKLGKVRELTKEEKLKYNID